MIQANIPNTFNKVFSTDSIATPPEAISMSNHEFDENHQFYVRPILDIIKELAKWKIRKWENKWQHIL